MSPHTCIVAVDVGNSAVKLSVRRAGIDIDHVIRIGAASWEADALSWVRDQSECRHTLWRVASVHRSAADRLIGAVQQSGPAVTIRRITHHDVPMRTEVERPERLGIDRLLSAYAARNRLGSPVVVVDAGSAVTVDWVDGQGTFCGGAILPGLALQARVLAAGTDALPQIRWDAQHSVGVPAKNTADAIAAGIVTGVSAAIDRIAQQYRGRATTSEPPTIVLTGGDAAVLAPHLRSTHQWIPNLVCRGLSDLPAADPDGSPSPIDLGLSEGSK